MCGGRKEGDWGRGGVIFGRALRPVQTGPGYLPDYDDDDDDAVNDIALSEAASSPPLHQHPCTLSAFVVIAFVMRGGHTHTHTHTHVRCGASFGDKRDRRRSADKHLSGPGPGTASSSQRQRESQQGSV